MDRPHYLTTSAILLSALFTFLSTPLAEGCPSVNGCFCENDSQGRYIINCRGQGHTTVPTFPPDPAPYYELTLAVNQITALNDNAFSNLNIKRLDLSENAITTVSDSAFNGMDNLEELVLHVKQLSVVPAKVLQLSQLVFLELKGFNDPDLSGQPFKDLTRLVTLHLPYNRIDTFPDDVFAGLTANLKHLEIAHNSLAFIPKEALANVPNIKDLHLGHNLVDSIPEGAFSSLSSLRLLDLSYNSISTIHENAFQGRETSLKQLFLSRNDLINMQVIPLKTLRALELLDVSENKLTKLKKDLFDGLLGLKVLNASNNQITDIEKLSIQNLAPKLEIMKLSQNRINFIEANAFSGFNALRELDLHGQDLSDVLKTSTFLGLSNLETLNLQATQFSELVWSSITGLGQLKTLTLKGNQIGGIPDYNFVNMQRLEHIDVSDNAINTLSQKSFHGLQSNLRSVDLTKNSLDLLNKCVFDGFANLNNDWFMNLNENPLNCDCRAQWLRQWIEDNTDDLTKWSIMWTCQQPASHQGNLLRNINIGDLVCSPPINPPWPSCENLTPPTSSSTPTTPLSSTTKKLQPMLINITDVADTSCLVTWMVEDSSDIAGFKVEYQAINGGHQEEREVGKHVRDITLTGLFPATTYVVCVLITHSDGNVLSTSCSDVTTAERALPITDDDGPPVVPIVLGVVFGVLALVLVILAIIFGRRYCKDDEFDAKDLEINKAVVGGQYGEQSKRFSKPKSTTSDQLRSIDMEKKLAGFTPEERDRILDMLAREDRGSKLSLASGGSRNSLVRYLPNDNHSRYPTGANGYDNRASDLREEGDHHYHEIPEEQHYHEIEDDPAPPSSNYI